MTNAIDLNDNNFEDNVVNEKGLVLVDFWASWCGPCRKLAPLLDEIAQEYNGKLKFCKLNTDDAAETAKKCSVSGIPTLLLYKDGEPVERMVGMLGKSTICSNIDKYID